jgi:hypothetical protein
MESKRSFPAEDLDTEPGEVSRVPMVRLVKAR